MKPLAERHREELERGSGIAPGIVDARGYWTEDDPKELIKLGFSPEQAALVPCMVLPMWGVDGEIVGYQTKPDSPRTNAKGKIVKYETPAGFKMRLDVGPGGRSWLADVETPIWITEGLKKGDCGASRGMRLVTLIGVWNWRGSDESGGSVELADWEAINLKGRRAFLCFDSDVMRKPAVQLALRRIAGFLRRRGATVIPIVPPDEPGNPGKTGLDDYFARGGTLLDLTRCEDPELLNSTEIMILGRSIGELAADGLAALVEANVPPSTFRRAGELVRIVQDERGITKIQGYGSASLRGVLDRAATWVKPKTGGKKGGGGTTVSFPPREVVDDILTLGDWPGVPPLVAVTRAPVLAPDGTLSEGRGYHPASGFYVASKEAWPRWTGTLREAVDVVLDVLVDFPFSGDADRAHALALMLLPVVRPYIAGPTPLHVIDAPVQGTGKSLLATVCLMPTVGDNVSATPGTRDEEEWRKKIASALLEGKPYLFLDNLSRKVDSDSLAGALTGTEWNDRALSTMTNINVPIRVVWVATANNVELSRDILRRTVWARIDSQMERPEDRAAFVHPDIKAFVSAHRSRIVSALCAIVRAWVEAGSPAFHGRRLGSFEEWSSVMGGILDAAGVPGFLGNLDELRIHADSTEGSWADFYSRWHTNFGTQPLSAGNLMSTFSDDDELVALLGEAKSDAAKITRLGFLLKKRVGVVSGDLRIERAEKDGHTKNARYRIARVAVGSPSSIKPTANPPQRDSTENEPESSKNAVGSVGSVGFKEPYAHAHTGARACEAGQKPNQPTANEPNDQGANPPQTAKPLEKGEIEL